MTDTNKPTCTGKITAGVEKMEVATGFIGLNTYAGAWPSHALSIGTDDACSVGRCRRQLPTDFLRCRANNHAASKSR